MRRSQAIGVLLWRGGLLVVAITAAVEFVRALVRHYDLPLQVELGTSLVGGGVLLILGSMVMERIADAKREGDLGS